MRILLLLGVIPIAACQPSEPNLLAAVDWTNGKHPCSERNLSFKNDKIANNVIDGRIELFDIEAAASIPTDTELVRIHAAPAKALRSSLASHGIDWPEDRQTTFIFRVHGNRLSLVGVQRPDRVRMEAPTATQANRFDLLACPLPK